MPVGTGHRPRFQRIALAGHERGFRPVSRDGRVGPLEEIRERARVIGVVVREDDQPDVREFVSEALEVDCKRADCTSWPDVDQHQSAFGLDCRGRHRQLTPAVFDGERKDVDTRILSVWHTSPFTPSAYSSH